MIVLIVVNDGPYSTERPYNALRLATSLSGDGDTEVRLFFMGDGAWCAVRDQQPPEGATHNIEWMLQRVTAGARKAAVCRTCMDQRGIHAAMLIDGAYSSSLDELTSWTREADRTLVF